MTGSAAGAGGHFAANVLHFARLLRGAGLPLGSDRIAIALQALPVAGLASRAELHAVLAACLIGRAEHRALFDQAFELFWRDADLAGRLGAAMRPAMPPPAAPPPATASRRLADTLLPPPGAAPPAAEPETDAALSWNAHERLRRTDFEAMSADEWRQAQRLIARLRLAFEPLPTRRMQAAPGPGRLDWRGTLAAMGRHGGELWQPRWRDRRRRPPPLVLLADISGSMSRYSRMLLHFGHALAQAGPRVESFVFGTRLTRTTRLLAGRDPDLAVALVARTVQDWQGGTRITDCLHQFNRRWARRVLGGGATVLLVSDGLEQGDTTALAFEMERLHKSCRRLIWLNPLLRFAAFEPRAGGIRAMLPHVDHFVPTHDIASLEQLGLLLAARASDEGPPPRRPRTRT